MCMNSSTSENSPLTFRSNLSLRESKDSELYFYHIQYHSQHEDH